jgi:hypothetical protein
MIRYSLFSVMPIRHSYLRLSIARLTGRHRARQWYARVVDGHLKLEFSEEGAAKKAATELLPSYWDGSDCCHDGELR